MEITADRFEAGRTRRFGFVVTGASGADVVGYDAIGRRSSSTAAFRVPHVNGYSDRNAGGACAGRGKSWEYNRRSAWVFGNDGRATLARHVWAVTRRASGVELFAEGGAARRQSADIWKLTSIWR